MVVGSTQPLAEMSTRSISWGVKSSRCVRLTTLPPSCAVVTKSGNLNFLEPSGPVQACNGTALPLRLDSVFQSKASRSVSQKGSNCGTVYTKYTWHHAGLGGLGKGAMVVRILFCSDQDGWLSRSSMHTDVSGGKMAQEGVSRSRWDGLQYSFTRKIHTRTDISWIHSFSKDPRMWNKS